MSTLFRAVLYSPLLLIPALSKAWKMIYGLESFQAFPGQIWQFLLKTWKDVNLFYSINFMSKYHSQGSWLTCSCFTCRFWSSHHCPQSSAHLSLLLPNSTYLETIRNSTLEWGDNPLCCLPHSELVAAEVTLLLDLFGEQSYQFKKQ